MEYRTISSSFFLDKISFGPFKEEDSIRSHHWITAFFLNFFGAILEVRVSNTRLFLNRHSFDHWKKTKSQELSCEDECATATPESTIQILCAAKHDKIADAELAKDKPSFSTAIQELRKAHTYNVPRKSIYETRIKNLTHLQTKWNEAKNVEGEIYSAIEKISTLIKTSKDQYRQGFAKTPQLERKITVLTQILPYFGTRDYSKLLGYLTELDMTEALIQKECGVFNDLKLEEISRLKNKPEKKIAQNLIPTHQTMVVAKIASLVQKSAKTILDAAEKEDLGFREKEEILNKQKEDAEQERVKKARETAEKLEMAAKEGLNHKAPEARVEVKAEDVKPAEPENKHLAQAQAFLAKGDLKTAHTILKQAKLPDLTHLVQWKKNGGADREEEIIRLVIMASDPSEKRKFKERLKFDVNEIQAKISMWTSEWSRKNPQKSCPGIAEDIHIYTQMLSNFLDKEETNEHYFSQIKEKLQLQLIKPKLHAHFPDLGDLSDWDEELHTLQVVPNSFEAALRKKIIIAYQLYQKGLAIEEISSNYFAALDFEGQFNHGELLVANTNFYGSLKTRMDKEPYKSWVSILKNTPYPFEFSIKKVMTALEALKKSIILEPMDTTKCLAALTQLQDQLSDSEDDSKPRDVILDQQKYTLFYKKFLGVKGMSRIEFQSSEEAMKGLEAAVIAFLDLWWVTSMGIYRLHPKRNLEPYAPFNQAFILWDKLTPQEQLSEKGFVLKRVVMSKWEEFQKAITDSELPPKESEEQVKAKANALLEKGNLEEASNVLMAAGMTGLSNLVKWTKEDSPDIKHLMKAMVILWAANPPEARTYRKQIHQQLDYVKGKIKSINVEWINAGTPIPKIVGHLEACAEKLEGLIDTDDADFSKFEKKLKELLNKDLCTYFPAMKSFGSDETLTKMVVVKDSFEGLFKEKVILAYQLYQKGVIAGMLVDGLKDAIEFESLYSDNLILNCNDFMFGSFEARIIEAPNINRGLLLQNSSYTFKFDAGLMLTHMKELKNSILESRGLTIDAHSESCIKALIGIKTLITDFFVEEGKAVTKKPIATGLGTELFLDEKKYEIFSRKLREYQKFNGELTVESFKARQTAVAAFLDLWFFLAIKIYLSLPETKSEAKPLEEALAKWQSLTPEQQISVDNGGKQAMLALRFAVGQLHQVLLAKTKEKVKIQQDNK